MKRVIGTTLMICLLLGSAWTLASAQQTDEQTASEDRQHSKVTPLMRMKLERSKLILEGLTMEDFDMIADNRQARARC